VVDVDHEVPRAQLSQVFEEALLLSAGLPLAATLPYAGPEDLFLGDIGQAFTP
jgi:hypothetical protein